MRRCLLLGITAPARHHRHTLHALSRSANSSQDVPRCPWALQSVATPQTCTEERVGCGREAVVARGWGASPSRRGQDRDARFQRLSVNPLRGVRRRWLGARPSRADNAAMTSHRLR
jgi:hypothetical protein